MIAVQRRVQQPWTDNRALFLDRVYEELGDHGTDVTAVMDTLSDGLWWFRQEPRSAWTDWADEATKHSVSRLVHQDPFTQRSFAKPRGYAGDAALLDLIYYDQGFGIPADVSDLGAQIYWRNRNAPAPRAVRERRNHLAALIDRSCLQYDQPRILALACGHLREGLLSSGLTSGRVHRLVAVDQDAESLSEVRRCFGRGVEARHETLRTLLVAGLGGDVFDCIYAAGLFDYLETPFAVRLTEALFRMLAPGGRLVLANFVPDILDAGYMETYMQWRLLYRTPDELHGVCAGLPPSVQVNAQTYFLESPDICYLAVQAA